MMPISSVASARSESLTSSLTVKGQVFDSYMSIRKYITVALTWIQALTHCTRQVVNIGLRATTSLTVATIA